MHIPTALLQSPALSQLNQSLSAPQDSKLTERRVWEAHTQQTVSSPAVRDHSHNQPVLSYMQQTAI